MRMVFEHEGEYGSQWAAISSIAAKLGMTPETLRTWVRRAETSEGLRPGLTTTERERLKALERENRELRRTNEILHCVSVFLRGGARPPTQEMRTYIDDHRGGSGSSRSARSCRSPPGPTTRTLPAALGAVARRTSVRDPAL